MSEDSRHDMVIRREERKHDIAEAKAEAYRETMIKTISATLKDARNKKSIGTDAMASLKDPSRRDELFAKSKTGGFFDNKEGSELDVITGYEDQPWKR